MATISPLTAGTQLTPVRKRRSRISHSPVKTPKATSSLSRTKLMVFPLSKNVVSAIQYDLPTAALEFEEFSFWGKDGRLLGSNVSVEHQRALNNYLYKNYGAVDLHFCEPFLVIGCKDVPPEDQRPFSVAGLISIWRPAEDMQFNAHVGFAADGDPIEIHPDILEKIAVLEIPPQEVILYFANHVFKDCDALTLLWEMLVVELPKVDEKAFLERLDSLPDGILGCPINIRYHNGPLPNTENRQRATKPKLKIKDSECDETDYVALDQKFYPGTMLNSVEKNGEIYTSVTAGVLVERGFQQRLTCSFHNWQDHHKKYPHLFGRSIPESQLKFQVTQGKPGTKMGFVRERMGKTDIALAQLSPGIVFENSFMEMEYSPKVFVRSTEATVSDEYMIDSFTTGKQKLRGNGRRFQIKRELGQPHAHLRTIQGRDDLVPPAEVAYIELEQGAYVTNDPVMQKKPFIREGVCGAVLLRCKDGKNPGMRQSEVMARGEIFAMMHLADLQAIRTAEAANYICYADSFDPLIDEGWTIVAALEPENPAEEAELDDQSKGSPSKKQKRARVPEETESPKKPEKRGGRGRGGRGKGRTG